MKFSTGGQQIVLPAEEVDAGAVRGGVLSLRADHQ